jgi:hypothetical protein
VLLLSASQQVAGKRVIFVPQPTPNRAALGDLVVLGKVTAVAADKEKAEFFKGDQRMMKLVTFKVERVLMGKESRSIKVGYIDGPGFAGGGFGLNLGLDQEGCLVLMKHPTKKDLFIVTSATDAFMKTHPAHKDHLAQVKKITGFLINADKGLKSKKEDERFATAALLAYRYKSHPGFGEAKTEEVPAEESKLLLEGIKDGDWGNNDPHKIGIVPQGIFSLLGVTEKDGWKQPMNFQQTPAEARKWLGDNAGKFKMTRYVREKPSAPPAAEPE